MNKSRRKAAFDFSSDVQTAFSKLPFEELKKTLATLTRAQFIKMFWFAELAPQGRMGTVSRQESSDKT